MAYGMMHLSEMGGELPRGSQFSENQDEQQWKGQPDYKPETVDRKTALLWLTANERANTVLM